MDESADGGKGGERKEDAGGSGKGKEEFLGIKLRRGVLVGKRGGSYTPPPSWSFVDQFDQLLPPNTTTATSARQLGANLWEILPRRHSVEDMEHGGHGLRRHHNTSGQQKKGLLIQPVLEEDNLLESDCGLPEQPGSTGTSFHRQIAESLRRHHRSVAQNSCALQPVSPASFCSSLEVTPYNPTATPSSSIELKARGFDPSYSLRTSTELLKVLNRIWSLEEQHASNLSLVRELKTELNNSRAIIKDLLKEKQVDRQVIDNLMKQVSEDKHSRRNGIDQDRIKSNLQSVKEELEDERKLRRRSESLHRKLARELLDVKSSLNKVVSELERERRARILLEDLCDEFAMSTREYEQEMRALKLKSERDLVCRDQADSLVLQISEAWLDERMQMKLDDAATTEIASKSMVVEKLSSEIEAFLKARQQPINSKKLENDFPAKDYSKELSVRRHSLESFGLNEAASAPKNVDDDDEDSVDSESNCFELNRIVPGHHSTEAVSGQDKNSSERGKNLENSAINLEHQKNVEPREDKSSMSGGMSRLQARFQQHMAKAMFSNQGKSPVKCNPEYPLVETGTAQKSETWEENCGGSKERKSKRFGVRLVNSLVSNNSSSIEGEKVHPEDVLGDESCGQGHFMAGPASPVKKWESRFGLLGGGEVDRLESCSTKWVSRGLTDNTLKAKLMEARLEGRNYHQSKGL